jgi:hypothetical protein
METKETYQYDIQTLLEFGFDIDTLKNGTSGLQEGDKTLKYIKSYVNPVGVEILEFEVME